MALGSYAGLQASIADFLNRTDLTNAIPDFITMAEAQINRRLAKDGPVREMLGRSDATITAEFIAVPTDFMGIKSIILTGSRYALEFIEPENITEYKTRYSTQDGDPRVYSIVGGQFQFWPWSGTGSYPAEIAYWKRLSALSSTNTSNWLLATHPDVYLYTALIQSGPYLKDDARLQMWASLSTQLLDDLVQADKVSRFAPHISVPFVYGGTP